MPEAKGNAAQQFAGDDGAIRGEEGGLGGDRHLELARTVLGKKAIGAEAGGAQRTDQRLAEAALATIGIKRISRTWPILDTGIDEFLLEAGGEAEAEGGEPGDRAFEKIARAALPGAAVRVLEIAEIEALGGAVVEWDRDMNGAVGTNDEIPGRTERRGHNRAETGHHDVGMGEADAALEAGSAIGEREGFAADQPGPVAIAGEYQIFALHGSDSVAGRRIIGENGGHGEGEGMAAGRSKGVERGRQRGRIPMRILELEKLAAEIPAGAMVAIPPDNSATAAAFARALVRQGARNLRLVGVPVSGYATDLLIGAGCVAEVQSSAVSLDEAGPAPCFTRAVKAGKIRMLDATCPAMHAMLDAAGKGIPFIPIRGILGSDLLRHRPDWRVIENPFQPGDPILLLPALAPDFAVFHAAMADEQGNVWVGRHHELAEMAHAAKRTLVTVERIAPQNLVEDERLAGGVISGVYIEAVAIAEHGAWPSGLLDEYPDDAEHFLEYARLARTEDGFRAYLDRYVLAAAAQAAE